MFVTVEPVNDSRESEPEPRPVFWLGPQQENASNQLFMLTQPQEKSNQIVVDNWIEVRSEYGRWVYVALGGPGAHSVMLSPFGYAQGRLRAAKPRHLVCEREMLARRSQISHNLCYID